MTSLALGALVVLLGSYGLVLWLRHRLPRQRTVEDFLFEGNRQLLAVSSGIGSMFSYSLAGTALVAAGYIFGWQVCAPIVLGALLGLWIYLRVIKNPSVLRLINTFRAEGFTNGASYPQAIAATAGKQVHFVVLTYLYFAYAAMLAAELAVVRVTLHTLLPEQAQIADLLLVLLLAVCFTYVFTGGFLGVLVSDHFQLIIIILFTLSTFLDVPWHRVWASIPGPSECLVGTSPTLRILLLVSAFMGSFAISLGNADQWYRTAGTLPVAEARRVLTLVVVGTTAAGTLLILLGSSAYNMGSIRATAGYNLSLILLANYAQGLNITTIFFLGMTLAAIGLTTLDTYIITLQQLYYEISIFSHAEALPWYLPEYFVKTRAIRVVGGATAIASFGLSFLIPSSGIYAWGALALGSIVPVTPLFVLRALNVGASYFWRPQVWGLLLSLILIPPAYFSTSAYVRYLGQDPSQHLYIVVFSLASSTVLGYAMSILAWKLRRRSHK